MLRKSRRAGGFSLLELLIVMVIITILAGMILVVGGSARDRAHRVSDQATNGTLHDYPMEENHPEEANDDKIQ